MNTPITQMTIQRATKQVSEVYEEAFRILGIPGMTGFEIKSNPDGTIVDIYGRT